MSNTEIYIWGIERNIEIAFLHNQFKRQKLEIYKEKRTLLNSTPRYVTLKLECRYNVEWKHICFTNLTFLHLRSRN